MVLALAPPDGHYGLLLAVVPFLAASVHGAQATAALGLLTVAAFGGLHLWRTEDSADVALIKLAFVTAAGLIAVLVSQARGRERTLDRTRNVALALQQGLLPRAVPGNSAVDVCHRYVPTDTEAGVGGDWFDVIKLSGARVALVMGDVVGHGIHAAATMGRLRTAVRTLADLDLPPDELLARMDDLTAQLTDEDDTRDLGATCLYLVYDPVSRRCTMASAGHTPPALARPGGTVEFPRLATHPPLGIGGTPFTTTELTLDEGTVIALYTDGLLDLRGRGPDAALRDLADALTPADRPLPQICERIHAQAPADRDDDIALLVARVGTVPADSVATWEFPPGPASAGRARAATSGQLERWGLDEAAFTAEIVVSELVTNAVRHAAPPVALRLIKDETLIFEVSDGSGTAPHMRLPRLMDEGGRGLYLVGALADRWGTRYTETGKTVWVDLPMPARASGGAAAIETVP
ncbi:serine/threonine-protein phosphatase [Streptomyces sp. KK5PA1]|uniref:Serine/threonine-protein phosphatase n=1 Tax=Actinacidiphila acididurans TaxID=2784346 RepID=A0ABS2U3X6_9ACTN|nr:serine/threonine-protein phosphatase [Actinacidiphila acididurans]